MNIYKKRNQKIMERYHELIKTMKPNDVYAVLSGTVWGDGYDRECLSFQSIKQIVYENLKGNKNGRD